MTVNLTQPSVSVRIRQLENEIGLKLFEQLGKKIALTEAGLSLIPHARRVVAAIEDARHCIQELQGLERGSLRIGASTTPGMYLIPKAIASFKAQHPNIEIHLRIKDTQQVEAGVLNNEFDFGFVGGHLVGHEVAALPWLTDQLKISRQGCDENCVQQPENVQSAAGGADEFFVFATFGTAASRLVGCATLEARKKVKRTTATAEI